MMVPVRHPPSRKQGLGAAGGLTMPAERSEDQSSFFHDQELS